MIWYFYHKIEIICAFFINSQHHKVSKVKKLVTLYVTPKGTTVLKKTNYFYLATEAPDHVYVLG